VLAAAQHGVVARRQLLERGLTPKGISHRIARGRLYIVRRAVYAVGRRDLTQEGKWMAAVLACGPDAVLSDLSAGALWGLVSREVPRDAPIEVTVPHATTRRHSGIRLHRRELHPSDSAEKLSIPVTGAVRTLLDLACRLRSNQLEAAVNEADKLDLGDPESLRGALDHYRGQAGVARLRRLLDSRTFTLTDSELERRFLPLARPAGLPPPLTRQWVNGFVVDFFWPDLGLVVETDGLRYHRTPAQQARDRLRDQRHTAAGLTALRFTHAQVTYEPQHVVTTLRAVARRLCPDD
jgi:very-short-patch-repair endonuclease